MIDSLADRYRIERELGAGGMATVYLAHDLKHDRDVAIKVLRPELAAVIGAQRFLAEIKTTANLQHPHILSLFDSGEVTIGDPEIGDGSRTVFYVMPFVDGESLRDRLTREKQLPIDDALRITHEVADALEYAHQHGVIHRDIKPENILLHGGHALVADFGIALAAAKIGGTRMTATGMSLGTPQYMSPEQAMGERQLDARTDVYALGCVTYEMLSGEPPFTGPTAQAIVAKVLTEPVPAIRTRRPSVPESVDAAVQTALQKLPADRVRSAAEFAAALERPTARPRDHRTSSATRRSLARIAGQTAAVTALVVAAFLLGGRLLSRDRSAPLVLGRARHVTWDPGLEVMPALSPDGHSVAYSAGPLANMHVMVRSVGGGRAVRLIDDTAMAESSPAWSPDGSRVLFLSRGGAFSAPAGGGPATPEVPAGSASPVTSVTLAPDGKRLAFTRGDSLMVREADASVHVIAHLSEPALCSWSPAATFIACATGNGLYEAAGAYFGNVSPGRIVLCRVHDGALITVTDSLSLNTSPAWSPRGDWLYFISDRDGPRDIYAIPIASHGETNGRPIRLSAGLGAHNISLSGTGNSVAYSLYTTRSSIWSIPVPVHPPATSAAATRVTGANEYIERFDVSRDGKWLYYDTDLSGNVDIFRIPTNGGEAEQLTTDPADDFAPSVSPDGMAFAFHSWRSGSRDIFVQRLDGTGVEQVTHSPRQEALPSWAPGGEALAFTELTAKGGVWIVRRDAAGHWGTPAQRLTGGARPQWSPDGRSIAFLASSRGGSIEIVPVDTDPVRTVVDATHPGIPFPEDMVWATDDLIFFASHDPRGNSLIWSVSTNGGSPMLQLRLDPVLHPSYRSTFVVRNGRIYFSTEDRQSDIWMMDVRKPQ